MGRPSKFTPDRCEHFLAALSAGVFPETAAAHAGWSPATYYRIMRANSPAHEAFRQEVQRVVTALELRLAGTVTQAAFQDPRLALSMLERRFGERWGRRAAPPQLEERRGPSLAMGTEMVIVDPTFLETIAPRLLAARSGIADPVAALERVTRFADELGPGGSES